MSVADRNEAITRLAGDAETGTEEFAPLSQEVVDGVIRDLHKQDVERLSHEVDDVRMVLGQLQGEKDRIDESRSRNQGMGGQNNVGPLMHDLAGRSFKLLGVGNTSSFRGQAPYDSLVIGPEEGFPASLHALGDTFFIHVKDGGEVVYDCVRDVETIPGDNKMYLKDVIAIVGRSRPPVS